MRALKKKRGDALFGDLATKKSIGVLIGVVAMVALICAFACEQKAGLKPSAAKKEAAAQPGQAAPAEVMTLSDEHCVFCHPVQPETIGARGAKHKSEVGCMDCHEEHPPEGTEAIPQCSMCHSDESHYELENCASCHSDTHAPLDLKLEGEISGPCLTCHAQQGDEVEKHPSAHTDVACNECHSVHRKIPSCMECHEKHTEDMEFETCLACHPVHMPLLIGYNEQTPSHYCGACHEEALDLLAKSPTKHHDLTCAFCHKNKHKTVPPCFACHPSPHPQGILAKFPECGQCHGIAHDLKS